jgi:lipopolysaccharide transport system permease protein
MTTLIRGRAAAFKVDIVRRDMADARRVRARGGGNEHSAEHGVPHAATRTRRIQPGRRPLRTSLVELAAAHELVFFLAQRDLKVRYRQTVLGAAWALLQPGATMLVFTIFLGDLVPVPDVPYAVFALAGLVPWMFFANATAGASGSLLSNVGMLGKIYFPRLAMPLAAIGAVLVDLVLSMGLLALVMLWYGIEPSVRVVWLPAFTLLAIVSAAGLGFLLSALSVEFRDFRYLVPFMLQTLLFLTPVAYPSKVVDEPLQTILALNPMAGVVEGYRWALFGTGTQILSTMLISAASGVVLLMLGVTYFHRREPVFADVA